MLSGLTLNSRSLSSSGFLMLTGNYIIFSNFINTLNDYFVSSSFSKLKYLLPFSSLCEKIAKIKRNFPQTTITASFHQPASLFIYSAFFPVTMYKLSILPAKATVFNPIHAHQIQDIPPAIHFFLSCSINLSFPMFFINLLMFRSS